MKNNALRYRLDNTLKLCRRQFETHAYVRIYYTKLVNYICVRMKKSKIHGLEPSSGRCSHLVPESFLEIQFETKFTPVKTLNNFFNWCECNLSLLHVLIQGSNLLRILEFVKFDVSV